MQFRVHYDRAASIQRRSDHQHGLRVVSASLADLSPEAIQDITGCIGNITVKREVVQ